MLATTALLIVLLSTFANGETCGDFDARLNMLSSSVEEMLALVESLAPSPFPSCGGLLSGIIENWDVTANNGAGAAVDTLITRIPLADIPTQFHRSSQWCCEQCFAYNNNNPAETPCAFWELRFDNKGAKNGCKLFTELPLADLQRGVMNRITPHRDGVLSFNGQPVRISGSLPHARWGTTNPDGLEAFTQHANPDFTRPVLLPNAVSNGPLVGYDLCDAVGLFKVNGADTSVTGGKTFVSVRDTIECCTLCQRNIHPNGDPLENDCVLWGYNYRNDLRRCYMYGKENAMYNGGDVAAIQDAALCTAYDKWGNRISKTNGELCTGVWQFGFWLSGLTTVADYESFVY